MKVLILIPKEPWQALLVRLHSEELVGEIKKLIGKRKNRKAVVTALVKGKFEKEVEPCEVPALNADLIISEDSARWDVTKYTP